MKEKTNSRNKKRKIRERVEVEKRGRVVEAIMGKTNFGVEREREGKEKERRE